MHGAVSTAWRSWSSERLARYGFRRRASVRSRPPRAPSCASSRPVASIAACACSSRAMAIGRGAASLPHRRIPGFRARALRERPGLSRWRRHARLPRRLRSGRDRRRRDPECACEAIMQGECRRAFVPIAGLHHAARDHAAGFCVFNDCGVAIELLQARRAQAHRLRRHRRPPWRWGVLRVRGRCRGRVCGHARGRPLPVSGHRRGRRDRTRRAQGTKLNLPLPAGGR